MRCGGATPPISASWPRRPCPTCGDQKRNLWLDRLESDHDNIRQALRWAIDADEGELAQGLAGTLYRFWLIRSHVDEGRTWLDQVLAMSDRGTESRGRAMLGAGTLALTHSDHCSGARASRRCSVRPCGRQATFDFFRRRMHNLGQILLALADYPAATALIDEELRFAEEVGDRNSASFALVTLGRAGARPGEPCRRFGAIRARSRQGPGDRINRVAR